MGIPLSVDLPNMELETIACLFPLLTYLGLSYTLVERLSYRLNPQMTVEGHLWGSTVLEKVQTSELEGGPKLDNEFLLNMGKGLKRCPNLRRLFVRSDEEAPEMEGKHDMTCFVKLVRQFSHVVIEFLHGDI